MPPHAVRHTAPPAAKEGGATIIRLDQYRRNRLKPRQAIKFIAVFGFCLLGLVGSLADSAFGGTGPFFLAGPIAGDGVTLHGVLTALLWATLANFLACAGVLLILSCLLSRRSAAVVRLEPRRKKL